MEKWQDAVYTKCMRLAQEAAVLSIKAWREKNPIGERTPHINHAAQLWVSLADCAFRGIMNEEETKACFILGYVPEYTKAYERTKKMADKIGPAWKKPRSHGEWR